MKKFIGMLFGALMLMVGVFSSCDKNEDLNQVPQNEPMETRASNGSFRSLNSFAVGVYRIDDIYKEAYVHKLQKGGECSWTNYVLAASAIIRAKGDFTYPDNAGGYHQKISHCKAWCQNNPTSLGSTGITTIEKYCREVDQSAGYSISCERKAFSEAGEAVAEMLSHLSMRKTPFIYIGGYDQGNQTYGHYYIIWNITWRGSVDKSTVWYTNTLDKEKDFNQANLGSFMRKNIMNNHNMLFLW